MYVYVASITPQSLSLYIKDLEHAERDYDDFAISLNDGPSELVNRINSDEYDSGKFDYLGLSPNTVYEVKGFVKFEGEWVEVPGASFSTTHNDDILPSPPRGEVGRRNVGMTLVPPLDLSQMGDISEVNPMAGLTEYYPNFYPRIQDQWAWGNGDWYGEMPTCVPASINCVKGIQYFRRTNRQMHFSNWWVYGNRYPYHSQEDGMFPAEAMEKLAVDGVLGDDDYYSSSLPYFDFNHLGATMRGARSRLQSEYSANIIAARENGVANWTEWIGGSYNESIKASIIADGGAVVWFHLYPEFYNTPSSGIVPPFTYIMDGYSHTLAVIGWKNINGVPHWICQNSWQSEWGDNGRCYMAMNNGAIYAYYTMQDVRQLPSGIVGLYGVPDRTYVSLFWAAARNVKEYRVNYRVKGSPTWIDAGATPLNRMIVFDLKSLTAYEFKVYAHNNEGNGTPSELLGNNAITTTGDPPPTPTNFRVYEKSSGTISMDWSAVSVATGYSVEVYSSDNTVTPKWKVYNISTTRATATGLVDGVTYNLKLWSIRDGTNSIPVWLYNQKAGILRPLNWEWESPKNASQPINLRAVDWNNFCIRVNDFRLYKNKASFPFIPVSSGAPMNAAQLNQARSAILELSPSTTLPSATVKGGKAFASFINGLRDSLNSIV